MNERRSDTFIRDLQKTGLSYEESTIFFALLQKGSKGAFASTLANQLNMKRTSMLSKLDRLVQKGCVHVNDDARAPRGVKRFVVTRPAELFSQKVHQTRQELEDLENLEETTGKRLEDLYQQGIEYGPDDLDPFLVPYLSQLLETGWKLAEQDIEKSKMAHGFDAFDCTLMPPDARFVKDCGFMAFVFHHVVEDDVTTIKFIIEMLLRRGAGEIFKKDIGVKDIHISETTTVLFNRSYPSLKMEFLFSPQAMFQEMTRSAIIPVNDKIFFLWGEDERIVEQMARAIFNVEKPITLT
ncbi:MAG TPA: hypothetical protein VKM55_18260 [Candidatus Lokiarchaeia archaeon]|nr:hypothetical protein [Candidatus Lokiarchaeia archaeon]